MSQHQEPVAESRQSPRLNVPAMYTLLRVKQVGDDRYRWMGHIYDISLTGMRFELDRSVPTGADLEVRGMLPGERQVTFHATGSVVRLHGDDDRGPIRMGMTFKTFRSSVDRRKLEQYLDGQGLRKAA